MPDPTSERVGELLPCPWCGMSPVVGPRDPGREGDGWATVRCTNRFCAAEPVVAFHGEGGPDACRADAIALWNARHTEQRQRAEIEALTALVDQYESVVTAVQELVDAYIADPRNLKFNDPLDPCGARYFQGRVQVAGDVSARLKPLDYSLAPLGVHKRLRARLAATGESDAE